MHFENLDALYLLLLPLALLVVSIKKQNYKQYFSDEMFAKIFVDHQRGKSAFIFLLLCYCALVIAIARPVVSKQGIIKAGGKIDIVVALDMSRSMQCGDIYPTRFAFAKQKVLDLIDEAHGFNITLIGFSDFPFLISSSTNDQESLRYLLKHTYADQIAMKGSNLLSTLKSTNELLRGDKIKALLIFTDGTDQKSFASEITYAKKHKIKVFVFGVATPHGGAIRTAQGFLKDNNGNIVITHLNPAIKTLSTQTGGEYFRMKASSDSTRRVLDVIRQDRGAQLQHTRSDNSQEELFYIPLGLAVLLFFASLIGVRR
jgi:Ca-activated chloride channel homolog